MTATIKVLIATDGSDHALSAARFASSLVGRSGAELHIVIVHNEDVVLLNSLGPSIWPEAVPFGSMDIAEIHAAVEKAATDNELAATIAASYPVTPKSVTQLWGQPAEAICRYAQEQNMSQIIVGTRGRSAFSKLLLGSVSMQVANHAHCPVTLVR